MAQVSKTKQLLVVTENRVGMLAEVTSAASGVEVNISAINAYAVGDKAYFRVVTSDNQKVVEELKSKGYEVSEQEVVALKLKDKQGMAKEIAGKLKEANIDLEYIYGTTCESLCECKLIFNSNDNDKAVEILGA